MEGSRIVKLMMGDKSNWDWIGINRLVDRSRVLGMNIKYDFFEMVDSR